VDLQELSDRQEISDLLTAYSYAVDFHRWDDLDAVFTADATLDLTATGGESGDIATMKPWLAKTLGIFAGHQHLVATSKIELDGDRASVKTICHNPMYLERDGAQHVLFVGLWYVDELVRTSDGWRIAARRQEKGYLHGL
jgi:3-phenylpropionate/cinnamic acid dioxygenase small subunit